MKKESKKNLNKILPPETEEIVFAIKEVCDRLKLDFYLIGAMARDVWLKAKQIPIHRKTENIDFALLVSSIEEFQNLLSLLINEYNFTAVQNNPHRLLHGSDKIVTDIIPFGGLEKEGYVHFNDRFDTIISTLGLKEVYLSLPESA